MTKTNPNTAATVGIWTLVALVALPIVLPIICCCGGLLLAPFTSEPLAAP